MDRIDDKVSVIRSSAKRLRLSCLTTGAYDVLLEAQRTSPSYDDFLISLLDAEVKCREERQRAMRPNSDS